MNYGRRDNIPEKSEGVAGMDDVSFQCSDAAVGGYWWVDYPPYVGKREVREYEAE